MASTSKQASENNSSFESGKDNKDRLKEKDRLAMIRTHRGFLCKANHNLDIQVSRVTDALGGNFDFTRKTEVWSPDTSVEEQKFSPSISQDLQPLKLRQIRKNKSSEYTDRVIFLTIIEPPMMYLFPPINLVCEDENGAACIVSIREVPHTMAMEKLLCLGRQLAIMSPYWRVAVDGRVCFRVNDPKTVVLLDKKVNMCRYCAKENAHSQCGRCKGADYCDKECQTADWKDSGHKLICIKK